MVAALAYVGIYVTVFGRCYSGRIICELEINIIAVKKLHVVGNNYYRCKKRHDIPKSRFNCPPYFSTSRKFIQITDGIPL